MLPAVRLRSVLEHELVALRALLFGHFASEEEGGYLADLVQAKPDLLDAAEELRAQHATLRNEFESLVQAAADAPLDALVERIGAALETFDAHEHAEAKLISGDLE
ncbi:MAG TPA: hypothetical protein PKA88_19795 [Polyangiaceae bacterium]|nr:hypothetical protein [Polyangiaceae bacterium]